MLERARLITAPERTARGSELHLDAVQLLLQVVVQDLADAAALGVLCHGELRGHFADTLLAFHQFGRALDHAPLEEIVELQQLLLGAAALDQVRELAPQHFQQAHAARRGFMRLAPMRGEHADQLAVAREQRRGLDRADCGPVVYGHYGIALHRRDLAYVLDDDPLAALQRHRTGGAVVHTDPRPQLRGLLVETAMRQQPQFAAVAGIRVVHLQAGEIRTHQRGGGVHDARIQRIRIGLAQQLGADTLQQPRVGKLLRQFRLALAYRGFRAAVGDGDAGHVRAELGNPAMPCVRLTRVVEGEEEGTDRLAVRAEDRHGMAGAYAVREALVAPLQRPLPVAGYIGADHRLTRGHRAPAGTHREIANRRTLHLVAETGRHVGRIHFFQAARIVGQQYCRAGVRIQPRHRGGDF